MKKTLGEIIKEYRLKNKLSLRDFAQKCDVSHTYIDKLEKGIDSRTGKPVEPTLLVIEKISKAMNKRTETLLEEIGFIKGESVEEDIINDLELGLWFKDIKDASPEKREELKRFWEFIKLKEKERKLTDEAE
ncbi:helix-turn-helix domain-containing protein [Bacillus paranthracis]|uniref:helix-turn-helix domain-containing protein n=1 Tax=Bacillus paranthracis TaxID=2026186 RepID=UPI002DBB3E24|nr:helix-turn-helix transcriptional regulator [Bacillus paranthracis]MEC1628634.1 helix-turn-helix transcriptional regulator [Bacillus paranthracis]